MAAPELTVVCKTCGAEVSPYVTECPYCGTRLRKRAPKLERKEGELRARESRRDRRRRRAAERRAARSERVGRLRAIPLDRPWATLAVILLPAIYLVVQRAAGLDLAEAGALFGPVGSEWWRYLSAPFVYDDVGYIFACGLALALTVPTLERRVGMVPTLLLMVACGALGMLAAAGISESLGDAIVVAAGGNGMALGALGAWYLLRRAEGSSAFDAGPDAILVAVAAAVLVLLPVFEDSASFVAGLAGGLVGLAAGFSASRSRA